MYKIIKSNKTFKSLPEVSFILYLEDLYNLYEEIYWHTESQKTEEFQRFLDVKKEVDNYYKTYKLKYKFVFNLNKDTDLKDHYELVYQLLNNIQKDNEQRLLFSPKDHYDNGNFLTISNSEIDKDYILFNDLLNKLISFYSYIVNLYRNLFKKYSVKEMKEIKNTTSLDIVKLDTLRDIANIDLELTLEIRRVPAMPMNYNWHYISLTYLPTTTN